jgi:hypothetical protein
MHIFKRKPSLRLIPEGNGSGTAAVPYLSYFAVSVAIALVWTLTGGVIAEQQGDLEHFFAEWRLLQGPFLIGLGTMLILISRSGALESRAHNLAREHGASPVGLASRSLRVLILTAVFFGGSASIIGMGFDARGPVLVFIWVSCLAVCAAAASLTLHTIDLLLIVHRLERSGIKTFSYSPARTPALRDIISYFTSFTFVLSIGYFFAFLGMLRGHWTGDPTYVQAVLWFWPLIYVPVCSVALIYPHVVMHRLVTREKEKTLGSYQSKIDELLAHYQNMHGEDIQRLNNLAQLFDRISATPDYVIDFGIAIRTFLPLAINVAILFAKPILGQI